MESALTLLMESLHCPARNAASATPTNAKKVVFCMELKAPFHLAMINTTAGLVGLPCLANDVSRSQELLQVSAPKAAADEVRANKQAITYEQPARRNAAAWAQRQEIHRHPLAWLDSIRLPVSPVAF